MINFAGRTAFVTGGANGIGIGLVRALLAEGCKVAIAVALTCCLPMATPGSTLSTCINQLSISVRLTVHRAKRIVSAWAFDNPALVKNDPLAVVPKSTVSSAAVVTLWC